MLVLSALVAYRAAIYLAIWRSAGHYKGPPIWAILAKAAVVVGVLLTVVAVVTAF